MKNNNKKFDIWNGIYNSFAEANADQNVFNDQQMWKKNLADKLDKILKQNNPNKFISPISVSREYPLSIVLAILASNMQKVSVLDFGGGMALEYFKAINSIIEHEKIEFHIVENETIVEYACESENLRDKKNIKYYAELSLIRSNINCAHIGSSLQYIENWHELLIKTAKFKPKYLVLSDLLAGDIETFITTQKYYDKKIPVRFININELLSHLSSLGYNLIYKSLFQANILNQEGPLPLDNMPEKYKLKHACNLIFTR